MIFNADMVNPDQLLRYILKSKTMKTIKDIIIPFYPETESSATCLRTCCKEATKMKSELLLILYITIKNADLT